MIDTPTLVCFDNGILQWQPVPGASGYNIHSAEDYLLTVQGGDTAIVELPQGVEPPYSVSAWVRDNDGVVANTARSLPAGSPFVPTGELVLDERFENLDNWLREFPYWDDVINNELQDYDPDAFVLTGNGVTIQATKQDNGRWLSGILTGPVELAYTSGFFEADIMFDGSSGTLPAWWLLNQKYYKTVDDKQVRTTTPECDIVEVVDKIAHQSYHSWHPSRNTRSNPGGVELTEGFSKYAVKWEPGRMTWFINRLPVFTTYGDHVGTDPMYPILNLAVGGNWPGDPADDLESAEMHVKSVQIWQD